MYNNLVGSWTVTSRRLDFWTTCERCQYRRYDSKEPGGFRKRQISQAMEKT